MTPTDFARHRAINEAQLGGNHAMARAMLKALPNICGAHAASCEHRPVSFRKPLKDAGPAASVTRESGTDNGAASRRDL